MDIDSIITSLARDLGFTEYANNREARSLARDKAAGEWITYFERGQFPLNYPGVKKREEYYYQEIIEKRKSWKREYSSFVDNITQRVSDNHKTSISSRAGDSRINPSEKRFRLSDIQNKEDTCKEYLSSLPRGLSFGETIDFAHYICPELRDYCEKNESLFNSSSRRDKGSVGKMVEFYIFGQLPDTDPRPDLDWGADIKATHFKNVKSGGLNAKERLTVTNVGSTDDYSSFEGLMQSSSLRLSKYYPKLRKGVLFVFEHEGGKYDTIEKNREKRVLCFFAYDLNDLPGEITRRLDLDYADIQDKVATRTVSQKGQTYLHIHPHGSKGSKTRALGFKNKFVTKLVSIYTRKPITVVGNSWFIEKEHFHG